MKRFYPGDTITCIMKNRYLVTDVGVMCEVIRKTDEFGSVQVVCKIKGEQYGPYYVESDNFKLVRRDIEYL